MLFWTFRKLIYRLKTYEESGEADKVKCASDFFHEIKTNWAASKIQTFFKGMIARRKYIKLKHATKLIQLYVRRKLLKRQSLNSQKLPSQYKDLSKALVKVSDIILFGKIPGHITKTIGKKSEIITKIKSAGARVFTQFPIHRLPKLNTNINLVLVCSRTECTSKKPSSLISKAVARGWKLLSFEFLTEFINGVVFNEQSVKEFLLNDLFLENHTVRKAVAKPDKHRHSGARGTLLPFSELKNKKKVHLAKPNQVKRNKIRKKQAGAYIQFMKENICNIKPKSLSWKEKRSKLRQIWKNMSQTEKDNYVKTAKLCYQLQCS